MFRMLLEACRAVGDSERARRVQAAMERLGLFARAPVATTVVQGSERQSEKGMSAGLSCK